MFTGIITRVGQIAEVESRDGGSRLGIRFADWERPLESGESIAINGVCLTVTLWAVADGETIVYFDVLAETMRVTNLVDVQVGDAVNLERALRFGDALGGHLVSGHIDGVGTVRDVSPAGPDWRVRVEVPEALRDDLVLKGSVTLNGVSLTIAVLHSDGVEVHLIPHTWTHTNLCELTKGSSVNVETDPIAKLAQQWVAKRSRPDEIRWEDFRTAGWGSDRSD